MKKSNHSKMDSSLKDIDLLTEVQELQVLGGNDNGANEKSQGSHTVRVSTGFAAVTSAPIA